MAKKITMKEVDEALLVVKNGANYDKTSKKYRDALEIVSAVMGPGIKNLKS